MTNPLTCKQNQKKFTNVENCEKTPTIKQFVYYFYTITKKWQKKKKSPYCPPAPLFGDVIIHETGTRLTQGGDGGVMGTTARTRQCSTGKGSWKKGLIDIDRELDGEET